jgi:uncharacterized RmlC-like cupin family protein
MIGRDLLGILEVAIGGTVERFDKGDRIMKAENHGSDLTCKVVRPGEAYPGKQALSYVPGISAETVGARGINLQLVTIPANGRAKAHLHAEHETAVYVLGGEIELRYGDSLQHHAVIRAGDFLYIPAGVAHLPFNAGHSEATAVLARTDPNEQESVVLLPDLDG